MRWCRQLVLERCSVLIKLVDSNSRREMPLLFTQFTLHDLIVSDWSRKVRADSSFYLSHY